MGTRVKDWETQLDRALRDAAAFRWGANDCCQFVARVVRAITGRDYAAQFHYRSRREAARILRYYGGIDGIMTACVGAPKNPRLARRGDVVMAKSPRLCAGVCVGHLVAVQGSGGIEYVPLSAAVKAWSI